MTARDRECLEEFSDLLPVKMAPTHTGLIILMFVVLGSACAGGTHMLEGPSGLIRLKGFIWKFGSDLLFESLGCIKPDV